MQYLSRNQKRNAVWVSNIADLYNIPIGNVKKSVHNFFDKEKYVPHYENLQLYLRLGLNLKKIIMY